MPKPYTHAQWLESFFRPVVLETRTSDVNPHLEVSLEGGRLLLNAQRANYSYGTLQQAFADCFAELDLYARKPAKALVLGWAGGSVGVLLDQRVPGIDLTGVELDKVVVEVYEKYFIQNFTKIPQVYVDEVLNFLLGDANRYNLVVVDVFQDLHVPTHVDGEQMLAQLRRATLPGGLLVWNRLIYPPEARARTEAFRGVAAAYLPGLRHYDTLHNRFWIWENNPR